MYCICYSYGVFLFSLKNQSMGKEAWCQCIELLRNHHNTSSLHIKLDKVITLWPRGSNVESQPKVLSTRTTDVTHTRCAGIKLDFAFPATHKTHNVFIILQDLGCVCSQCWVPVTHPNFMLLSIRNSFLNICAIICFIFFFFLGWGPWSQARVWFCFACSFCLPAVTHHTHRFVL